jgi:hypothetical protein
MKTKLNVKTIMTGICLLIAACLNTIQANYDVKQYLQITHPNWGIDKYGNRVEIPNNWEIMTDRFFILRDHEYGIVFRTETYTKYTAEKVAEWMDTAIFNNTSPGRDIATYYYKPGIGQMPYRTINVRKENPDMEMNITDGKNAASYSTGEGSASVYDTMFYFTAESPEITLTAAENNQYPYVNLPWADTTILMQHKEETIHLECYSVLDGYRVADLQLNLTFPLIEEWLSENMRLKAVSATTAKNETVTGVNELTLTSTDQYTIRCIPESELCGVETADGSDMTIQRKPTKRHYEEIKSFNVKYGIHTQLHKVKFIYPSRCVDFQLTVDSTVRESTDPETGYKVFSIIGTEATVRLKFTEFEGEEKYFNITGYTGRITGLNPDNNILTYTVENESGTEERTDTIIVRCLQDNANFTVDLLSPVHSQTEGENDTTHIVLASHSDGWVSVSVTVENEETAEIKFLTPNALLSPLKHDETRVFTWVCKSIQGKEQRKVLVVRRKSNIATIEPGSTLHITEENGIPVLGTELPEITLTDPKSTCIINEDETGITVISEDGNVQQTYGIRYFNFNPEAITVKVCGKIAERNRKTYTAYVSKNSEWENRSDVQTDIKTIDSQTQYTVIDIKTGRIIKDNVKAKEAAELIKKLRTVTAIQKK